MSEKVKWKIRGREHIRTLLKVSHSVPVFSSVNCFMTDGAVFWCQVNTCFFFFSFVETLRGKSLISFDLLACGPNPLTACFCKKCFIETQLHLFVYVLSMAVFMLEKQR